jgi:hypothetical protein
VFLLIEVTLTACRYALFALLESRSTTCIERGIRSRFWAIARRTTLRVRLEAVVCGWRGACLHSDGGVSSKRG